MIEVRRHAGAFLDALGAPFEIAEEHSSEVLLRTQLVDLRIHYDPRDSILVSMIRPRNVPEEISDFCQVRTLLNMLGFMDDDEELRTNYVGDLAREIRRIGIVMRGIYLAGPQRIRDASFFDQGYGWGYTSHFTIRS